MPDKGHWMVNIKAARVNGVELDMCKNGTCRGVVDIGTSHIGVPTNQKSVRQEMLTRDARDLLECRIAQAPVLEFELEAINLTVNAGHYMRRIPLREGVDVGIIVVSRGFLVSQCCIITTRSMIGRSCKLASVIIWLRVEVMTFLANKP